MKISVFFGFHLPFICIVHRIRFLLTRCTTWKCWLWILHTHRWWIT